MDAANMSDGALIGRIHDGERGLLDTLISRHYDRVWRYIRYKTGDTEAAYDLTQETFLRVIKAVDCGDYTERSGFGGYVMRIAHNLIVDRLRSAHVQLGLDAIEETADVSDGIGDVATHDAIDRALSRLPEEQREAVILANIGGYTSREIAAITGVKHPTVKSRLRLGSEKLEIYLREEGFN